MLSKYIVLLCSVSSVTFGATLNRRDATTVRNDLTTVDNSVKTLNARVSSIANPATGSQVVAATQQNEQLNRDILKTYNDCVATVASSVTQAQAQSIIDFCNSPLFPDIQAVVTNIIGKRTALNNYRSTVYSELQKTQRNTTQLNTCLLQKTPASPTTLRPAASSCVNKVNAAISSAVNAYRP